MKTFFISVCLLNPAGDIQDQHDYTVYVEETTRDKHQEHEFVDAFAWEDFEFEDEPDINETCYSWASNVTPTYK